MVRTWLFHVNKNAMVTVAIVIRNIVFPPPIKMDRYKMKIEYHQVMVHIDAYLDVKIKL